MISTGLVSASIINLSQRDALVGGVDGILYFFDSSVSKLELDNILEASNKDLTVFLRDNSIACANIYTRATPMEALPRLDLYVDADYFTSYIGTKTVLDVLARDSNNLQYSGKSLLHLPSAIRFADYIYTSGSFPALTIQPLTPVQAAALTYPDLETIMRSFRYTLTYMSNFNSTISKATTYGSSNPATYRSAVLELNYKEPININQLFIDTAISATLDLTMENLKVQVMAMVDDVWVDITVQACPTQTLTVLNFESVTASKFIVHLIGKLVKVANSSNNTMLLYIKTLFLANSDYSSFIPEPVELTNAIFVPCTANDVAYTDPLIEASVAYPAILLEVNTPNGIKLLNDEVFTGDKLEFLPYSIMLENYNEI